MTQQNTKPILSQEEDEIDLIALAKAIWDGRKTILKITLIFMAIGLFIALFSEKEYTASSTFVPQTSSGSSISGSLGGLAAMAGINLGSLGTDSDISPTLYPQIINSVPFRKQLLQAQLTIKGQNKPITYFDYYTNVYRPSFFGYLSKYIIGLPGIIIKAIKGKSTDDFKSEVNGIQLLTVTEDEKELFDQMDDQLTLDVNSDDGYVTLSVKLPEALPAAQFVKQAQELLQNFIINFKVSKSIEQLKFIEKRYKEKEVAFKAIQKQLANFKDRNQNINTTLAQSKLVQFQSEYDLAFSVYTELAKQLEAQQLQVKQDTPVFTVIQPVNVPIEKSAPKGFMILFVFTLLGGLIGIGVVIGKQIFGDFKNKWNLAGS